MDRLSKYSNICSNRIILKCFGNSRVTVIVSVGNLLQMIYIKNFQRALGIPSNVDKNMLIT
jgi:hypothetical protein